MIKACLIRVYGDVQGVFYRHNAKKKAIRFGVSGWTKNEHDGSVTIIAQGEEEAVQGLIEWSKEGSPMATVSDVKIEEINVNENLKEFRIL